MELGLVGVTELILNFILKEHPTGACVRMARALASPLYTGKWEGQVDIITKGRELDLKRVVRFS